MQISTTNKVILVLVTVALLLAAYLRFAVKDEDVLVEDGTASGPAEYKDMIRVDEPLAGSTVTSPVTVKGEARGMWFFEASFPVLIVDTQGLIIGEGFAQADGDWMTESYVPFTATITFSAGTEPITAGALILRKSNASGLPEHDDAFEIPVKLQGGGNPPPVQAGESESASGNELAGTAWEWVRSDRTSGEDTTAPVGKFVITFGADGTASSATDCNSMSGPYSVNDNLITFGPMMSTLMFCAESVETFYASDLEQVEAFLVTGNELNLQLKNNGGTMYFKRSS